MRTDFRSCRKKPNPESGPVLIPGTKERIKTRKARVIEAFKHRGKLRLKDRLGHNLKQHFGTWKYFINPATADRQKFYISLDCRKFTGAAATEAARRDRALKSGFMSRLGRIGLEGVRTEIRYWGIPPGICGKLESMFHITKLYDWQAECLGRVAAGGENLIYSAPTSGGKSLVAEMLMLRAVLCEKRRAIYVLPYISIVSEKADYIRRLTEDVNVKIEQFHGRGTIIA